MNPFDSLTYEFDRDGDATFLAFSDGQRLKYAGAESWPDGWRYSLNAADGSVISGPHIDVPRFKAWFAQNGFDWDTRLDVVQTPIVVKPEAPEAPVGDAPPAPPAPVVAPTPAAPHHSALASLRELAGRLGYGAKKEAHDILDRLEHLFHRGG